MSDLPKFSRRSVVGTAFALPLAFAACNREPSVHNLVGRAMGTSYSITVIDETRKLTEAEIRTAIDGALAEVDVQMSNWNPASEISRFNAQTGTQPVTLSPELAMVIDAAEQVHLASDGRFDTTVGPLIELWGFGAPGAHDMPAEAQITEAMARIGHERTLSREAGALRKRQGDAQVYLSAIGKGYGVDRVARAIAELGVSDFMVEIGGDMYAAGRNPNGLPWQIGIETPAALGGGVYDVVGISGVGLATSGDYRNYFEQDGQRFSHVIDPTTGRPVTHRTASTTVIAENSMLADAWATAMLVLGRERGLEIARAHDVAVMFLDHQGEGAGFASATSPRYDALVA